MATVGISETDLTLGLYEICTKTITCINGSLKCILIEVYFLLASAKFEGQ